MLREHDVIVVPITDADDEGRHAVAGQREEEGLHRLATLLLRRVVLAQELQHRRLGEGAARTARIPPGDVGCGVRVEDDLYEAQLVTRGDAAVGREA